jgi:hypothetical protein
VLAAAPPSNTKHEDVTSIRRRTNLTALCDVGHVLRMEVLRTIKKPIAGRKYMYSRTQNENGTFNTRCLHCFMTVASAVEREVELDRLEEHHICPERALADLLAHREVPEAHAGRN